MEDRSSNSRVPRRLDANERSSLLIVGGDADLRLFLQGSLQRWYQIAQADTGDAAVEHLTYCPPQGLVAGWLATGDKERLISALCETDGPPVLKLWRTHPPSGWADQTLRYPFTRTALLRAVDRLVCSEDPAPASDDRPRPDDMQLKAGSQA